MDFSDRLLRLLKSNIGDTFDSLSRIIDEGSGFIDEKLSEWERSHGLNDDEFESGARSDQSGTHREFKTEKVYVDQFTEDLGLFGLTPPSSLDEVRQARNREIKKFHPDKFVNEPEKQDVAKQIMQIYNSAYDRLKKRFEG